MGDIPIGTKGLETLLVTAETAIDFLGLESARVLSTPHMIGYMERVSRRTVLPLLDHGHDTVGTRVEVSHLAAAPLGATVTFSAEVIGVEGRRVRFHVEARDEKELIGEGMHERTIIDVARFANRASRKKRS
jgi:fluoroacetyl-CoA thioesterase